MRYGFVMTIETFSQYWALVIASVLGTAVLLFVAYRVVQDSAGGRLRATANELRNRERDTQAAAKAVDKAVIRLERLRAKADSVVPRQAEQAREALQEAQELQKLVEDQELVVRNNVRMLILEEYPPKLQEPLRQKYLKEST